jgi:hypothetical protein
VGGNMGDYDFTVGELNAQIKRESKMNLAQLGSTDASQNAFIWPYMTEALWELAGEIKKKRTSDPLVVTSNGYVTFQVSGADIEDLYAPLRILTPNEVTGTQFQNRTSFDAPLGWYRETANDKIHIKGAGTYVMQYIAYHPKITSDSQALEIPQTSYGIVKDRVIAKIKESSEDLAGVKQSLEVADSKIKNLVDANKNAMRMMN